MSRQLSVAQQNEATLSEIERVAALLPAGCAAVGWLPGLLAAQGLSSSEGLLVEFSSVPEQEGEQFYGTWLSTAKEFWKFSVIVSRQTRALLEIEHFQNVTQTVVGSAHVPGTGKSFGYLALQALRAAYGG